MRETRWIVVIAAVALVLAFPILAAAQEHPEEPEHPEEQEHPEEAQEHPEEAQEHQEHPEHPEHPEEGEAEAPALDEAQLADAIEAHVAAVAEEHGGTYPIEDPETGETLSLELVKVHEERLARTAPHTYFACVDFAAADGTTYDVDFFMHGETAEGLEFEDFSIHKVNGEPRYTWHEGDGVWKKKPVGEEGEHEHPEEEHEHPEHPEEPPPR
jgi:cell division septation protein DedD